jgi:hypothetical protein
MNDFQKYLNGAKLTRLEYVSAMALPGLIARDGARGTNTPREYMAEEAVKLAIALLNQTYSSATIEKYTNEN